MSSIFRLATTQAIKEIIEEHGNQGRFGLIVTPEGLEHMALRIVDLFEMTLELRSKTSSFFEENISEKNFHMEKKSPKNSEENHGPEFKLPRKKFELSLHEKDILSRQNNF